MFKKYNFIAGVFFMAEILPILSRLSKTFQIENIDFSAIKPALNRARKSIEILNTCSKAKSAEWQKELLEWENQSHVSLGSCNDVQFLDSFALPFIQAIELNLKERFPEHDVLVISAAEVFNPSTIPSDQEELYSYGKTSITTLATHYTSVI